MAAPFIHELQADIAAAESLAEGLAQENTDLERELDVALRLNEALSGALDHQTKEVESLRQEIAAWKRSTRAVGRRYAELFAEKSMGQWVPPDWRQLAPTLLPLPRNPEPSRFRQLLAEAVRELERSPTVQGQTTWTQEGPHSQQQS